VLELSIPLRPGPLTTEGLEETSQDFRREYARRYGEGSLVLDAPLELVTLRATGIGRTVSASFEAIRREPVPDGTPADRAGSRRVALARVEGPSAVDTYLGADLRPGHRLAGPALVDGVDTTIWVPPRTVAQVDRRSTLVIEVQP
jgi:N-methylhydantoinase A